LIFIQATNEKVPMTDLSSVDGSSASSKVTADGIISNLSSDTTTVDPATTIGTDNDDTVIEESAVTADSTEPDYLSSLSFVDLVETLFTKKEDIKPVENIEQVSTNVNEELNDTATVCEEMPLLSTEHEPESEPLINNNSEEMKTTVD
jgi:hypothetical protein